MKLEVGDVFESITVMAILTTELLKLKPCLTIMLSSKH
jgi:hypothetical protein